MPTSETSALADAVAAASPSSTKAKQTRERILQAACDVVMEEGAGRLTLDAVVARAGVSKGAFLYHFKTKRDLLLTLIDDQVSAFDGAHAEHQRTFADDPDPWLSGQVASMPDGETQKLSGALLAAVAEDPTLLEPMRDLYRRQYQHVRKSPRTAEVAALVLLALDGLFFSEMMAFPTLDSAERHQLMGTLLALARGDLELTIAEKS